MSVEDWMIDGILRGLTMESFMRSLAIFTTKILLWVKITKLVKTGIIRIIPWDRFTIIQRLTLKILVWASAIFTTRIIKDHLLTLKSLVRAPTPITTEILLLKILKILREIKVLTVTRLRIDKRNLRCTVVTILSIVSQNSQEYIEGSGGVLKMLEDSPTKLGFETKALGMKNAQASGGVGKREAIKNLSPLGS
nr:hypothetical protein [Tanacetum cinerariifolium]